MTHMHYDHTGAVAQLPRSTFIVDGREWEAAIDGGFRQGYRRQLFDQGYEWRTLDFGAPQVDSFASEKSYGLIDEGKYTFVVTVDNTATPPSFLITATAATGQAVDASSAKVTLDHLGTRSYRDSGGTVTSTW